jgi:hypothetical protein
MLIAQLGVFIALSGSGLAVYIVNILGIMSGIVISIPIKVCSANIRSNSSVLRILLHNLPRGHPMLDTLKYQVPFRFIATSCTYIAVMTFCLDSFSCVPIFANLIEVVGSLLSGAFDHFAMSTREKRLPQIIYTHTFRGSKHHVYMRSTVFTDTVCTRAAPALLSGNPHFNEIVTDFLGAACVTMLLGVIKGKEKRLGDRIGILVIGTGHSFMPPF